jgi:hypothetical protein
MQQKRLFGSRRSFWCIILDLCTVGKIVVDDLTLWPLRSVGNVGVLRARKPRSLVRAVVRRVVCARVCLWISSGGLAVWSGRGELVSRCPSALAHSSKILIDAATACFSRILHRKRCDMTVDEFILQALQGDAHTVIDIGKRFERHVRLRLNKLRVRGIVLREGRGGTNRNSRTNCCVQSLPRRL